MRSLSTAAGRVFLMVCVVAGMSVLPAATLHGADSSYVVDGIEFGSRGEYLNSDYFRDMGKRCGTPDVELLGPVFPVDGDPGDCTMGATNIDPAYNPGNVLVIPTVVHVISTTGGTGNISDAQVQSQIDILNEDFLALAGTPGSGGTYTAIEFVLADTDPGGSPTNGINRVANNTYFYCSYPCGAMKTALRWDTTRYFNMYTNDGDGLLGWATFPQQSAGTSVDGVVVAWDAFGRNSPFPPYNQGRTATHEIGHYLGLFHTFQSGCGVATPPGCYTSADLICDTEPDLQPHYTCVPGNTCGYRDPIENYMEYTNDTCMTKFTPEQMNRMRCSLVNYRPDLYNVVFEDPIFTDGFESGNTTEWSNTVP